MVGPRDIIKRSPPPSLMSTNISCHSPSFFWKLKKYSTAVLSLFTCNSFTTDTTSINDENFSFGYVSEQHCNYNVTNLISIYTKNVAIKTIYITWNLYMGKTSKNSWAMKQERSLGTCSKKRCQWTSGPYFVFWVRLSTVVSSRVVTPVRASDWRCLIVGLTSTRCRETALLNSSNWEKTCKSRNVKSLVISFNLSLFIWVYYTMLQIEKLEIL